MSSTATQSLSVFAPAKINLFLHVTGRRDDGYHELDSLVSFADIGDKVKIERARAFSFNIKGPFAGRFQARDKDASPDSGNLVVRAAWELSRVARRDLGCRVTLEKNLPLASGIGGGSSDAAAMIWGLMEWWGITAKSAAPYLDDLMAGLGADVPVCLDCEAAMISGVSATKKLAQALPEIPVLLVHPPKPCETKRIFMQYDGDLKAPVTLPDLSEKDALLEFLAAQENVLTLPATAQVPEIALALELLEKQKGCLLPRMSGSGATCFGLFESEENVMDAAEDIMLTHPDWWVRGGVLNRTVRY